jgi:integrase
MDADDLLAIIDLAEKLASSGRWLYLRDLALVSFIVETGCRPGEARTLRLSRLNLKNCEATVKGKRGRTGKRGKRGVDYTDATAEVLEDWLQVRPKVCHDFVFVGRCGEPLSESGL